ncbi:hypothetical protein PENTCL1PPCAC_14028, partial [Pristionchus entomophagus]
SVAFKNGDLNTSGTIFTRSVFGIHNKLITTAIPVLFSYVPLATVLIFPAVTGISLGAFGNVLFSTTSIFPS